MSQQGRQSLLRGYQGGMTTTAGKHSFAVPQPAQLARTLQKAPCKVLSCQNPPTSTLARCACVTVRTVACRGHSLQLSHALLAHSCCCSQIVKVGIIGSRAGAQRPSLMVALQSALNAAEDHPIREA